MLVYFGVTPDAKPKVCVTPDASQWNIGGVGCSGVGHVYFMYISCCLCIIFRVGYAKIGRRKPSSQWNMGLCLNSESVNSGSGTFGPAGRYIVSTSILHYWFLLKVATDLSLTELYFS